MSASADYLEDPRTPSWVGFDTCIGEADESNFDIPGALRDVYPGAPRALARNVVSMKKCRALKPATYSFDYCWEDGSLDRWFIGRDDVSESWQIHAHHSNRFRSLSFPS